MLVLDTTSKSITVQMSGAAATTNPSFVTAYSDDNGTTFVEGSSDGALNGTTQVTLVASPAASTRRLIKTIYIENGDTAPVTITVTLNNSGTLRTIAKVTLQVGDTWSTDGTTDTNGNIKGLGTSGYSGYSGIGTSGYSGYSGAVGASGISGYSGYSGSGVSGYSGFSGYSGLAPTGSANTWTATQTFNGSSSTLASVLLDVAETVNYGSSSAPASTVIFYLNSGAIIYFGGNATTSWTVNFAFSSGTTMNSALSIGQSVTMAMLVTQGSGGASYYNTAVQVDGTTSGVTTKWQGGTAPSAGNASGIDVYTYTVIKTASATYTVLASLTQFK